jgi:hypothetical protein
LLPYAILFTLPASGVPAAFAAGIKPSVAIERQSMTGNRVGTLGAFLLSLSVRLGCRQVYAVLTPVKIDCRRAGRMTVPTHFPSGTICLERHQTLGHGLTSFRFSVPTPGQLT